jgi:D-glycero-D-manno-heptose 1,7-bisphosphate phosphatase
MTVPRVNHMQFWHVILDRDGVLNHQVEVSGYVREPSEFHWLPGALEGLAILRGAGVRLSVATNQSGVGRGLMSLEQLKAVHRQMQAVASHHGGALDAVLFCSHAPQAQCQCRKPGPGLILTAVAQANIPAAETLVIGDDQRDVEAAWRAGVKAALVRTGKGRQTEELLRRRGVPAYDNLLQLARAIVKGREVAFGPCDSLQHYG